MSGQMRQPRLAELVASRLREEILSGRLGEGDSLPRQEDLIAGFQVGLPSLREAMRILETEGLVSVRRGNVGGAVVHVPTADRTAYMLSLVLQRRGAPLSDTGEALAGLEPLCAGMCAARADRAEAVVPALRELLAEQEAVLRSAAKFNRAARAFHERVAELSGNETLLVVVGALAAVWSAHEAETYRNGTQAGPREDDMRAAFRDHTALVDAIEAGDGDRAVALSRAHLTATHAYTLAREESVTKVSADVVRGGARSAGLQRP